MKFKEKKATQMVIETKGSTGSTAKAKKKQTKNPWQFHFEE